jgi:branched-chain amino acid transport system ATP-binding protein
MPDLLEVEGLSAGYGEAVVISDIGFALADGQSMALLGRNGTGKTTLINSILGLATHKSGSIRLAGRDITRARPERRVAAGIGWSPQERSIFRSLTVEENLTAIARPGTWTLARVFAMFPRLAERRGNLGSQLSGGEQQMLAIGRALIVNPRLLLLDEPLEGLAPIIVEELLVLLAKVIRNEGLSAVVVEQKARKILGFTDRAIILDRGRIVFAGDSATLAGDPARLETHLGVTEQRDGRPAPAPPTEQGKPPAVGEEKHSCPR